MTTSIPSSIDQLFPPLCGQKTHSLCKISAGNHSYYSLGNDYYINTQVHNVPDSNLVLFNQDLARELNLDIPASDAKLEQLILKNFAWFKYANQNSDGAKNEVSKTFFSTRYQDSDDKSKGSALGDGRAIWVGEIINKLESGKLQYFDVVLKGTGTTELAWLNHPRENHKDGQISLTEAVHEYIYSSAAKANGITAVGVLAVIELPFYRKVDNEKAAIVIRVGNHLRFAHYCYFADNSTQLQKLFDYGLKRNMGLSLTHSVNAKDVQNYLDFIVSNLATDAAIYFDVHAIHGSPTFGNITSCGGTIDFATFVFTDAHHSNYSYMSDGANLLGGEWGQTEQFFNLFSSLIKTLKRSRFGYESEILPVEFFLESFNEKFEHVASYRWLKRIGLSEQEIDSLSVKTKEFFYEIVKIIYELKGSKKIKFNQRKIYMAAFEPRKILSATARHIENINDSNIFWEQLFKVNRNWGTYKQADAKPFIKIYQKSIINIINELKPSKERIAIWQQRSKAISLSERNEPGADLFYESERFFASEKVLHQINLGKSWRIISKTAEKSASKLVDQGFVPLNHFKRCNST
ncbi:MAG: protein adenylyltransferase SelO family protein [Methylococcaceae bacterium]